jgi:hypothetical protein
MWRKEGTAERSWASLGKVEHAGRRLESRGWMMVMDFLCTDSADSSRIIARQPTRKEILPPQAFAVSIAVFCVSSLALWGSSIVRTAGQFRASSVGLSRFYLVATPASAIEGRVVLRKSIGSHFTSQWTSASRFWLSHRAELSGPICR